MELTIERAPIAPTEYSYPTREPLTRWVILDIETIPREEMKCYVQPDSRLKDETKVAASIEEKAQKLALDMNACQVVAVSAMCSFMSNPFTASGDTEHEGELLEVCWNRCLSNGPLLGFNLRNFDIPVLIQRTRLLGMPEPLLDYGRYSKQIIDLQDELQCGGFTQNHQAVPRKLKSYCDYFGVEHCDDDCDGSQIYELYKAGDWDAIRRHCEADVLRVYGLAKRIGLIG